MVTTFLQEPVLVLLSPFDRARNSLRPEGDAPPLCLGREAIGGSIPLVFTVGWHPHSELVVRVFVVPPHTHVDLHVFATFLKVAYALVLFLPRPLCLVDLVFHWFFRSIPLAYFMTFDTLTRTGAFGNGVVPLENFLLFIPIDLRHKFALRRAARGASVEGVARRTGASEAGGGVERGRVERGRGERGRVSEGFEGEL